MSWPHRLGALALTLALAACSSAGETNVGRIFDLAKGRLLDRDEALDVGREAELTREQLNQIPFATIAFRYGELPRVFMIPLAENNGYLTYQDEGRRGVVMFGGAVAGTDGLGDDLLAVRHGRNDPIAYRRPLADWPRVITRSYQYRVRGLDDYVITPACEIAVIEHQPIEIVELTFDTWLVEERCGNARRQFTNRYWVDQSGFVWASNQWLGPNLEDAYIEIVRPYGG